MIDQINAWLLLWWVHHTCVGSLSRPFCCWKRAGLPACSKPRTSVLLRPGVLWTSQQQAFFCSKLGLGKFVCSRWTAQNQDCAMILPLFWKEVLERNGDRNLLFSDTWPSHISMFLSFPVCKMICDCHQNNSKIYREQSSINHKWLICPWEKLQITDIGT